MHCLVTGAAGFIGSTLSERLIADGHMVTGIDCLHPYYDRRIKSANLARLLNSFAFTFVESDLLETEPSPFLSCDIIFHLAGQPGVRASWGTSFNDYVTNNIQSTQRLLEIVKDSSSLKKFVFASSSSVYGNCPEHPLRETARPSPISPYGVTKLTAEHLCSLYRESYGIPVTSLRYFTVYGPRQRPDMAFSRFFLAALLNQPITIYGDGDQTRDFTYIDDIVGATVKAGMTFAGDSLRVMNIGAGSSTPLNRVFDHIADIVGTKPVVHYAEAERGDMRDTLADIGTAREVLEYEPSVELIDGLRRQYKWMRENGALILGSR